MKRGKVLFIFGIIFLFSLVGSVSAVCVDGTPDGQCSHNPDNDTYADSFGQPYRCVNDELVLDCNTCDCFGEQQSCNYPGRGDCTVFSHIRTFVANSNSVYGNPSLQYDLATHFDMIFGDKGLWHFRNYSNAPLIGYINYFEQSFNNAHQYTAKADYFKIKSIQDGIDPETMYVHFRKDTQWADERYIPGWNSDNDPDGDGVNNYLFTEIRVIPWTDGSVNFQQVFGSGVSWVNKVWVYDSQIGDPLWDYYLGELTPDDVPGDYVYPVYTNKGECTPGNCNVTISPNPVLGNGPFYVYVEVFGESQPDAPNPDAHALYLNQSRVRDYYWIGRPYGGSVQRALTNMNSTYFRQYNADWIYDVTHTTATNVQGQDLGQGYHWSGLMVDNTMGLASWTGRSAVGEILEHTDSWGQTGAALQTSLNEWYSHNQASTFQRVQQDVPDKTQYPNCAGYFCYEELRNYIDGDAAEFYLRDSILFESTFMRDTQIAKDWQIDHLLGATANYLEENINRSRMSSLASYYIAKNDYLYFYSSNELHAGLTNPMEQEWMDAMGYDIGQPTHECGYPVDTSCILETGIDSNAGGGTYKIFQRDYENALILYKDNRDLDHYKDFANIYSVAGPFTFGLDMDLTISIDGGAFQNINIVAGTYTSLEMVAYLNPLLQPLGAGANGGMRIYSLSNYPSTSTLQVQAGGANNILGFPTTVVSNSYTTTSNLGEQYYILLTNGSLKGLAASQFDIANQMGLVLIKQSAVMPCDVDATQNCGPIEGNTGECSLGTQICEVNLDDPFNSSNGRWSSCQGSVYPTSEICQDGLDNDCDGSDLTCQECQPGTAPAQGCLCNGEVILGGEFCPYGPGGSIVFQQGLLDYSGTVDARIYMFDENTTFNFADVWPGRTQGVIKFDLSSLSPGDVIESANLSLYHTGYGSVNTDIGVYKILRNWTKPGVTWLCTDDVANDGCINPETAWEIAGAGGTIDIDSAQGVSSIFLPTLDIWNEWDVTNIVKDWVENGQPNYGLLIRVESGGSSNRFLYASSLNANQTIRPKLEVKIASESSNTDVNNDGIVNIIDLALTTYWQGKNSGDIDWEDYNHLDVDGGGMVDWADVLEVLSKMWN